MNAIESLEVLNDVVRKSQRPYQEHAVLERCYNIVKSGLTSNTVNDVSVLSESIPNVTFDDPDTQEGTAGQCQTPKQQRTSRKRATKKDK